MRRFAKGAEQDYAKARELIYLLRSLEHPSADPADEPEVQRELDAIEPALWTEAVELVEAHAATIKAVAEKLVGRIKHPGYKLVLESADLDSLQEIQTIVLP